MFFCDIIVIVYNAYHGEFIINILKAGHIIIRLAFYIKRNDFRMNSHVAINRSNIITLTIDDSNADFARVGSKI